MVVTFVHIVIPMTHNGVGGRAPTAYYETVPAHLRAMRTVHCDLDLYASWRIICYYERYGARIATPCCGWACVSALLRHIDVSMLQVVHLMRHGVTEMNVYLSTNRYGSKGFRDPML